MGVGDVFPILTALCRALTFGEKVMSIWDKECQEQNPISHWALLVH